MTARSPGRSHPRVLRLGRKRYRLGSDRLAMVAVAALFVALVAWDLSLWTAVLR